MKSATSDKINGLFSLFNPLIAQLDRTSLDQASLCFDSYQALGSSSVNSFASLATPTPKSCTELEEIDTLELEIMHLERHLLSLYRTAFQGCALPITPESHLQFKTGHSKLELQMHTDELASHHQTSLAHCRTSSDNRSSATVIKPPSKRDRKIANSRLRSLADHLGDSVNDSMVSSLNTPDRLSEDIVRCISSIYCKLANPQTHARLSASPTSSLSSSSIFSSKNPCDSWSPHCNEYATVHQGLKEKSGPCATMTEVSKICLDDDSFNYAAKFQAYLAHGTHNRAKSSSILKRRQTLFLSGKNLMAGSTRHLYALEYPEPLVHFALCSGACSDPEVRAYTAKSIFQDLKLAQTEFIQDSVWSKETKVFLPKILDYYAKDMSLGMLGLMEEINECLSDIQKKALRSCMQGKLDKGVQWLPQSSTFRYVIHEDLAKV